MSSILVLDKLNHRGAVGSAHDVALEGRSRRIAFRGKSELQIGLPLEVREDDLERLVLTGLRVTNDRIANQLVGTGKLIRRNGKGLRIGSGTGVVRQ